MDTTSFIEVHVPGETLRESLTAQELREQIPETEMTLLQFLDAITDAYEEEELPAAMLRNQTGHKNRLFYLDEQLTWTNPDSGWPEAFSIPQGELYWINNQFAPMVDSLAKEAAKSRASYSFSSLNEDVAIQDVAQFGTALVGHYQPRLLTPSFLQLEFLSAAFDGTVFRYLRTEEGSGRWAKKPQKRQKAITLDPGGASTCTKCGFALVSEEAADATGCPKCGGDLNRLDPVTDEIEEEAEATEYRQTDFVLESVPAGQMLTNSWARGLDEAIWLQRYRELDWSLVRARHPNARLSIGGAPSGISSTLGPDREMDFRRASQIRESYGGASVAASSRQVGRVGLQMRSGNSCRYKEDWFKPVRYQHYACIRDEVLPDGTTLKAGETLASRFPEGLCVRRVDGEIVALDHENFCEDWVAIPYKPVPGRFWGKGIEGAIPLQEWLNELVSLIMTYLMEASSPTRVVDGRVFPENVSVGGVPSILWRTENKPADVDIDKVFRVFPPGQLSDGAYMMLSKIVEMMQAQIGAWSAFGSGTPDAAGNTATGMSLMQEAATNLMATVLALRAEGDSKTFKLLARKFKKFDDERSLRMGGPYSKEKVYKFRGVDINFDLDLTVREGSFFPRAEFQRRNDIREFWDTKAVIAQTQQVTGEKLSLAERRILGERFNIPEVFNRAELGTSKALKIIETVTSAVKALNAGEMPEVEASMEAEVAKRAAEQILIGAAPDTTALAEEATVNFLDGIAPLREFTDFHQEMVEFFIEWANSDDGEAADPVVIKFLERRIPAHLEAYQAFNAMMTGQPSPEEAAIMAEMSAAIGTDPMSGGPGPAGGANSQLPTGRPSMPSLPRQQPPPLTP